MWPPLSTSNSTWISLFTQIITIWCYQPLWKHINHLNARKFIATNNGSNNSLIEQFSVMFALVSISISIRISQRKHKTISTFQIFFIFVRTHSNHAPSEMGLIWRAPILSLPKSHKSDATEVHPSQQTQVNVAWTVLVCSFLSKCERPNNSKIREKTVSVVFSITYKHTRANTCSRAKFENSTASYQLLDQTTSTQSNTKLTWYRQIYVAAHFYAWIHYFERSKNCCVSDFTNDDCLSFRMWKSKSIKFRRVFFYICRWKQTPACVVHSSCYGVVVLFL